MNEEQKQKIEKEITKSAIEKVSEVSDKKSKSTEKPELEREYVIPLRRKVQKVPKYRRAKKAILVIRQFLAKHMKVEDRDLNKIKINKYLNNEIWFRGIKNPPAKIKVKAIKTNGIVNVELAEIPEKVKWDIEKHKKRNQKVDKEKIKEISKKEASEEPVKEERAKGEIKEESIEGKEKEKSTIEAGFKEHKKEAKQEKHTEKPKQPKQSQIQRKALKK